MNVFIIGAGASASLSPSVPVMDNFFRLAAGRIVVEKKEYWFPFAFTDRARLFPKNEELERVADDIFILNSEIQKLEKNTTQVPAQLKDHLRELIQKYKDDFLADQRRIASNLEILFDKFLQHACATDDDESMKSFLHLINSLFYDLNRELEQQFEQSAYMYLADFLKRNGEENTFISFNYEIWLEQALMRHGLFNPVVGYSKYAPFSYSLDVDRLEKDVQSIQLKSVEPKGESMYVLKPNGSLSWWLADWSYAGGGLIPRRQLFLTLTSGGQITQHRQPTIENIAEPNSPTVRTFAQPHIHPPTFSKSRNLELDWNTDRQILEILSQASTFIIIGWSMPKGDVHFSSLMHQALIGRMKSGCQPPRLIICNLVTDGSYPRYRDLKFRLASSFRPIHVADWINGFSKEFVDFLSKHLR